MVSKFTTCQKAIQLWEEKNPGKPAAECDEIRLIFQIPPIEKLDSQVLNTLIKCKKLSMSSNVIDRMVDLQNLRNLEILSLGRNAIKRLQGLESVGGSLRELWISYNLIESLNGLQPCVKLRILYIGNNKIKDWNEVDKLKDLPELTNVVLKGNPIYENLSVDVSRDTVLKRVQTLKNIDGILITDKMVDKVKEMA